METTFIIITTIVCLAVIAVTLIWSKGRLNALNERADELDRREKEVLDKEYVTNFAIGQSKEVAVKYVATDSDYSRGDKMINTITSRMAQKIGWDIVKKFGKPASYKNQDGKEVYVYRFRVKGI